MGDEDTLSVHYEGLTGLADLDLGDYLPDELQVHLRRRHPAALPALGDRDRHVGLGFFSEIHGPAVDAVGLRVDESRIVREVGLAADGVHGQAGDPQLLPPRGVDIADLCDVLRLVMQPEETEAA